MYHDHFVPEELPCPLAEFVASGTSDGIEGVSLVHLADSKLVQVGQVVTFTAWILNASSEVLTNVTVELGSFTNEANDTLVFDSQPTDAKLSSQTLLPGRALTHTFTYRVKAADTQHGGLLINALKVRMTSPDHGALVSECDAYSVATQAPDLARRRTKRPSALAIPRTVLMNTLVGPIRSTRNDTAA